MENFKSKLNVNKRQIRLSKRNFFSFRRNNRYNRNKNIPVISNKPVTLGAGTSTLNVTNTFFSTEQTVTTKLINDILSTSSEYVIKQTQYAYMKINYIKIITFPSQLGQYQYGVTYIYMNWVNDNDMTAEQIANSDNVKIIPNFQTRNKVYTYIPPNAMVGGYNPRIFHSTQVTPYQGTIYVTGSNKLIRVEVNVIFRGARDYQLGELVNTLQKLKIRKELEKEEEDKKENDNVLGAELNKK